jgi:hypothetical protein
LLNKHHQTQRQFTATILIFLVSFCAVASSANKEKTLLSWQTPLPRIQNFIHNTQHLEVLGKHHIVVVHGEAKNYFKDHSIDDAANHNPVPAELYPLPDEDIQLTYAFTVIQAPAEKVKETLMDFAHYRRTMPHIIESKLLEQQDNHWLGQYRLTFQMPLLSFEPQVQIQHTLLENGDLIERRIAGDIDYSVARWQIIALDKQRTLLLQTSWADIGSVSWLMRLVFAAQPDMNRLSPLAAAALTLQSLKERIEKKHFSRNKRLYATKRLFPDNTHYLTTLSLPQKDALNALTKLGSVNMISSAIQFNHQRNSFTLQPILSAVSVPQDYKELKQRATNIKEYPKHMRTIHDIEDVLDDALNHQSQWSLGFNFAIFTFDIDFGIKGLWNKDQTQFTFASTQGDFEPLIGRINWYPNSVSDDKSTLVTMALAHNISDDAGYILNAIKHIPYSQMFAGLYVGTLLIEGQQELTH